LDFYRCSFPGVSLSKNNDFNSTTESTSLAEIFSSLNEVFLRNYIDNDARDENENVMISFSHFLPRQELCPEKRFLIEPGLTKVIGSNYLESQIRKLRSNMHIVSIYIIINHLKLILM
jgi:hypothetical protein